MQKTNHSYEVLIGEDRSTDKTGEIVLDYGRRYPDRIKVIINERNMGGEKNLENIIDRATGEYIAICEGDDFWIDPGKLQRQVDYLEEHPECVMVFHSAKVKISKRLPPLFRIRPFRGDHRCTAEEIIRIAGGKIPTQSKVFRKSVMADLPDWYLNAHVGDMAKDLLFAGRGLIAYLDRPMSVYRLAVKGSWTRRLYTGPNVIPNKIRMMERDIELYERFDAESSKEYHPAVEEVVASIRHGIQLISSRGCMKRIGHYKGIISSLGILHGSKMIVKYELLIFFAKYQKFRSRNQVNA